MSDLRYKSTVPGTHNYTKVHHDRKEGYYPSEAEFPGEDSYSEEEYPEEKYPSGEDNYLEERKARRAARKKKRREKKKKMIILLLFILLIVFIAIAIIAFLNRPEEPELSSCAARETTVGSSPEKEQKAEITALNLISLQAGEALTYSDAQDFVYLELKIADNSDIYNRICGKSYQEDGSVLLSDLRYIKLLHYNYDGQIQVGELIVNQGVAEDVIAIFKQLFEQKYEINSVLLPEEFWTGDAVSTESAARAADNTFSFLEGIVTQEGAASQQAAGLALVINPRENPRLLWNGSSWECAEEASNAFMDRLSGQEHMLSDEDACVQLFLYYGFTWGGEWENATDYSYFGKSGS